MAECIEREAVIDLITRRYENPEICTQEINSLPAAHGTLVTRCKDCKHRIYKNMGDEIGEIGGCGLFNCAMPNEGFCSHGERKDGGNG